MQNMIFLSPGWWRLIAFNGIASDAAGASVVGAIPAPVSRD